MTGFFDIFDIVYFVFVVHWPTASALLQYCALDLSHHVSQGGLYGCWLKWAENWAKIGLKTQFRAENGLKTWIFRQIRLSGFDLRTVLLDFYSDKSVCGTPNNLV